MKTSTEHPSPELLPTVQRRPQDGISVAPAKEHHRVLALDGIRGAAITAVLLVHFTTEIGTPVGSTAHAIRSVLQTGWTSLDLFFVLSGFLITGILVENRESHRYFRTFYSRRILRIFPLYYGFLVLVCIILPLLGRGFGAPPRVQALYWAYVSNFKTTIDESDRTMGPLWSVSVEEQFYLVWPLIIYLCSPRIAKRICIAAVAGDGLLRLAAAMHGVGGGPIGHFTYYRLDGLMMGSLVAISVRETGTLRVPRWLLPLGGVALVALTVISFEMTQVVPAHRLYWVCLQLTALALVFGAFVGGVALAPERSLASRIFSWRGFTTMGTFSYAMYVLHIPLANVLTSAGFGARTPFGVEHPLVWLAVYPSVMIALTLVVGFLSWNLYEKHFLKLKRFFIYEAATPVPSPRAGELDRSLGT